MKEMKLQEVHDRLVAARPEGVSCPEDCPFCSGEYASLLEGGNNVSEKTYSDTEIEALVSAAVTKATAEVQAELDAYKAGEESAQMTAQMDAFKAETQAAIDAAKAEAEAQINDLTAKLDAAVVDAEQAKTQRDEITAWLDAEAAKVVEEAEKATLRAQRIGQVAEVVTFPEDYVAERAEKWASLDDEQFEALLADYKALGEKTTKTPGSELPPRVTAMVASRETSDQSTVGSALADIIRGRAYGVNPRDIR